jgi:hypothetical protein
MIFFEIDSGGVIRNYRHAYHEIFFDSKKRK